MTSELQSRCQLLIG